MTEQSETDQDALDPVVTVVVPAMNDAQFLRTCLRSIREQWFQQLECVVVDDGSTDDTASIAQEFADKDERFSTVSHATSRGPSAARNTGVSHSSAPFVTFLDADDFLYQHAIKSRVEALQQADQSRVAGSFCDWQSTPQNEAPQTPSRAAAKKDHVVGFVHGPECPFIVTAPIVRRSVLAEVGGFDESPRTAEDFDLWVRILRQGYTFVYVPRIGVAYRQKSTGLVFSESAFHADSAVSVIERQYEDLSGHDDAPMLDLPLPHYQQRYATVRRLLRTYALAAANNKQDDVDRIGQLIPEDLDSLQHAGLDVAGELRAGVWRGSKAIPELRNKPARAALVNQLVEQLSNRAPAGG